MLTNEEVDAVCRSWRAMSDDERAAIVRKADVLRAKAHEAPPFQSAHLETWRLRSREIQQDFAESFTADEEGVASALEVATLEKLFSSPKIKVWESAYRAIQDGLNDPCIASDQEMRALFERLLLGIAETADGGMYLAEDPDFGRASFLVLDYLVTPAIERVLLSQAGRINGRKPHVNHAQATARIPSLWEQMRADGKSKNEAAPLIADRLGLAETTIRKKLQGLK